MPKRDYTTPMPTPTDTNTNTTTNTNPDYPTNQTAEIFAVALVLFAGLFGASSLHYRHELLRDSRNGSTLDSS
ncbi:hypothetical protein C8A01DRAFT_40064 [Parachaetomium inaequale]|uniref:Uncharacterized protein n=1 Tax=Parachaetomium inaequale TaxID=2588326 RepID=A0AAN6SN53_9PEZI|nr:hypothetical protein C8A01DRAFT_40064 [Parachaetomium inaequale]